MDTDSIRDDIMNTLKLTSLTDRARVERAIMDVIDYILTYHKWSFLQGEDTIAVTSVTNEYTIGRDDFLFPIPGSMGYPDGRIKIISQEQLRTLYPNLGNLTELKYAVFTGKTVKFHSVASLTGSVNVHYSYQRTSSNPDDLDVDPGFRLLVKAGAIFVVAEGRSPDKIPAGSFFSNSLERKKSMWTRHYEGESQIIPEERHEQVEAIRRGIRWRE